MAQSFLKGQAVMKRKIQKPTTELEQKKLNMMKKRKRNQAKRSLIVFAFLFICIGVIFVVLKAPIFDIKTVFCVGQEQMSEAEILDIAKVKVGNNIFSTNIRAIKRRLGDNPQIAESNVRRLFPNKVKIWVKEAKVSAYLEHEKRFLCIDKNGKIIKILEGENTQEPPNAAKLEGVEVANSDAGKKIAAEDDARAGELFECMEILSQLDMLDSVNYINFGDLSDIKIDYENRLYMLLGSYENMEYKLKFIKKVITENISEYEKALFDYRGEKLYVGPRDDMNKETEETVEQGEETTENSEDVTQKQDSQAENVEE